MRNHSHTTSARLAPNLCVLTTFYPTIITGIASSNTFITSMYTVYFLLFRALCAASSLAKPAFFGCSNINVFVAFPAPRLPAFTACIAGSTGIADGCQTVWI